MVTCDGAGASHELVKELDRLASRRGYQVIYSVGWALGAREKAALGPGPRDRVGSRHRRQGRGPRAPRRRRLRGPALRAPGLLDRGSARHRADRAAALGPRRRPARRPGRRAMRVFARRERPHPGAQLSLFEAADGWRYSPVGHQPARRHERLARPVRLRRRRPPRPRPRRGRHPHRQGHRPRAFPLARLQGQPGVARRVHDRLHPAGLAEAARPGRRPREGRAEDAALPRPARRRPPRPRRAPQDASKSPRPGPGPRRSPPPGSASRPSRKPPDQREPVPAEQERRPRGPWNPRPPGPTAGPPSYPRH